MAQVLALDVAPHGEAEGWRKGEHLVDALAYIDSLDDHDKEVVNALLEEEVRTSLSFLAEPLGPARLLALEISKAELIIAAQTQHKAAPGLPEGDAPPAAQPARGEATCFSPCTQCCSCSPPGDMPEALMRPALDRLHLHVPTWLTREWCLHACLLRQGGRIRL